MTPHLLPEPTLDLPWPDLGPVRGWLHRNRFGLSVSALTWLVLLLWWVAYFPGLARPGSITYSWPTTTGQPSVLYGGLVWLSLHGTGGVAALTLAQTAVTAASLGFAAAALHRIGVRAWLLLPLSVALVALPTIGTFVICIWPDVGSAIATIFAFGTFVRLAELRLRRRPVPVRLVVVLGAELTVLGLMRPSGFVTVAAVGLLGFVVCVGFRRTVLAAAAPAVAICLAANIVVFHSPGLDKDDTYADISVVYAEHPDEFTPPDLDLMRTAGSLSAWRTAATCVSIDPLLTEPGWSRDAADQRSGDFTALWLRLLRNDPGAVLAARACRAAVIWKPWATGRNDGLVDPPLTGEANVSTPLSALLHRDAVRYGEKFNGAVVQAIEWRGSLWSYVTYLVLLVAFLRRRRIELLSIGVLTAASQLSLLPLTPGPAAQYMFASLMLGVLVLPLVVGRRLPELELAEAPTVALDATTAALPGTTLPLPLWSSGQVR